MRTTMLCIKCCTENSWPMDRKQNYLGIHQLLVLFYFSPFVHLPLERLYAGGAARVDLTKLRTHLVDRCTAAERAILQLCSYYQERQRNNLIKACLICSDEQSRLVFTRGPRQQHSHLQPLLLAFQGRGCWKKCYLLICIS